MQDILDISVWWLMFFTISIVSIPTIFLIFRKFADKGYGFTKILGLLFIAYPVFVLSSLKISPFTEWTMFAAILFYIAFNLFVFKKYSKKILQSLQKAKRLVVSQEMLFTFGFLLWSLVRGHQPDINGLEKFMDLGFINSLVRTEFLPPADMWFAGQSINYYWFGHFIVAFVTKLSGIPSFVTFNLMLATIMGMTLVATFSIVTTLVSQISKRVKFKTVFLAGIISAVLLTFAGNFHTPFFTSMNYLKENYCDRNKFSFCTQTNFKIGSYWYPDATRFIGYNPETEDKTIHEFPMYSFVVSDLHAHLINLPFVLAFIGLLLRYALFDIKSFKQKLKATIPLGFVYGVFIMTSTWDAINFGVTMGIFFAFYHLHRQFLNKKKKLKIFLFALFESLFSVFVVIITALLTASLFLFKFESIAQGVQFVNARSPLWQLAILWGFPAVLTFIFLAVLILKIKIIKKLKTPDIFVLSLLVASWVLIIAPEIVFVKDIYIASHHRANTMFKLTYSAYVMTYLTSGYIAIRHLTLIKKKIFKFIAIFFWVGLFWSITQYPFIATNSYYGNLKTYKGLRGDMWLQKRYPNEYSTVKWFNDNIKGQPTILEASGDSYTDYNMVSSYTGLPTVSGWFVHEWLWRGDSSIPQERVSEINQIYNSENIELTNVLLKKYQVKYVIVGTLEREKYPQLNENKFTKLGKLVFTSGNTNVYQTGEVDFY